MVLNHQPADSGRCRQGAYFGPGDSQELQLGQRRLDAERYVACHHLRDGTAVLGCLGCGIEAGGVEAGDRPQDLERAGNDRPIAVHLLEGYGRIYLQPGWATARMPASIPGASPPLVETPIVFIDGLGVEVDPGNLPSEKGNRCHPPPLQTPVPSSNRGIPQ